MKEDISMDSSIIEEYIIIQISIYMMYSSQYDIGGMERRTKAWKRFLY